MAEKMKAKSTVDADEVARFSSLASTWWDESGPMRPLHKINALRVKWIVQQVRGLRSEVGGQNNFSETSDPRPLTPFSILDIGCGGGLVCEPLARLGARVTGIDASAKNIEVAKVHAMRSGLEIDYRCTTAEELCGEVMEMWSDGEKKSSSLPHHPTTPSPHHPFDVVLALEIVEHVADVEAFVAACCNLVKPGGTIIFSTLNRTTKSFALGIVAAEYVLRWLPRGTHDWQKFLKPSELCRHLRHNGIEITEMTGMVMSPMDWKWKLDPKNLDVNYLVAGRKN